MNIKDYKEKMAQLLKEAKDLEDEMERLAVLSKCWKNDFHDWALQSQSGDFTEVTYLNLKCEVCGIVKDINVKVKDRKLSANDRTLTDISKVFNQEEEEKEQEMERYQRSDDDMRFDPNHQPEDETRYVYKVNANTVLGNRLKKDGDK